ncbi:hypothetical protein MKS88_003974 [Plasmodium brasilianum]|uniref:Uncharacterized protein n=1 Tax=Plasmodium brasilianum TaxID=5824 RepID=A0ACB9Y6V3_PLABR|nr:hypothetical protein MKS88_003974 [Plasmodium brasilianum]
MFLFNSELSTFSKTLDENCYIGRRLVTRNFQSLAKHKLDNSNNVYLKKEFQNNGVIEKKDIYNNDNVVKVKNKKLNRSLLNKEQYYTEITDYANGIFDEKHFHMEK